MTFATKLKFCHHFIGGEFVKSHDQATFPSISSVTGEKLTDVALGRSADVQSAVDAARTAFFNAGWRNSTYQERAQLLRRIGDLLLKHADELAAIESRDTGKPLCETMHGDIPRAAANFHFFADLCVNQSQPGYTGSDGSFHVSVREPIGVVGLITPWNLPLYLLTWKLAPALAQGNTVVMKPAELTPMSATALCYLLEEAGTPPGVVNMVHGFGADGAGAALVQHPEVKAISFTGETNTGVAIMRDAAPHLKKLSFELGGKGASVIFADADLVKATATATRAAFRNQGQICLAGSRLLVEASVYDEVISRIQEHMDKIIIGDPLNPHTTMGALISVEHRDRVASFVELAQGEGCKILKGGKIPTALPQGAYFEPTLIGGVKQSSRLIQEEVFGPVLTVQSFHTTSEALDLLNGTPYGLSCSIWSSDPQTLDVMSRGSRMGMVWLNSWFLRELHTAFGGMKRSGIGREGGQYSLDFFSEFKTVSTPRYESVTLN